MNSTLPRLMVATEFPPNASGGGPAVVRQMLRDWPADRLSWWSCLPDGDGRFGQHVAEHRCVPIPARLMPHRRFTQVKSTFLETFWAPRATAHLAQAIRELEPDVLWVIPHNWAIPPLHAVLTSGLLRFHTTIQDYVNTPGNAGRLGHARSERFANMADALYACARTRDATSHPMIADLKQRTAAPAAQMLHAGLEAGDFAFLESKIGIAGGEIRIAYAGTILVEPEFALFVEALDRTRHRVPRPVSLHFFGAHSYATRPWFRPEWMREHGNLADPALSEALRGCSFGFSPMALTDENGRYNRYSFPTKFISYLAAGLPIISLGHKESSLMKMTAKYAVGLALERERLDEMSDKLTALFAESRSGECFKHQILRCARAEFDATRMRETLYRCFKEGSRA